VLKLKAHHGIHHPVQLEFGFCLTELLLAEKAAYLKTG
jgi:hypothetical protein